MGGDVLRNNRESAGAGDGSIIDTKELARLAPYRDPCFVDDTVVSPPDIPGAAVSPGRPAIEWPLPSRFNESC